MRKIFLVEMHYNIFAYLPQWQTNDWITEAKKKEKKANNRNDSHLKCEKMRKYADERTNVAEYKCWMKVKMKRKKNTISYQTNG